MRRKSLEMLSLLLTSSKIPLGVNKSCSSATLRPGSPFPYKKIPVGWSFPMGISSLDCIIGCALSEDLCKNFKEGFSGLLKGSTAAFSDITTHALFTSEEGEANLIAKSNGILSGTKAFKRVFELVDPGVSVDFRIQDARKFSVNQTVAVIKGAVRSILMAERTALNLLGHLSGIATETGRFVEALCGSGIKILDTRKTLPGLRVLEKEAVVHGGGMNHRMGLYDMVLIKDNHIDRAGSITGAVKKVRARYGTTYKIEVETRDLSEVEEAVALKVDRIMLDNMKKEMIKAALKLIDGQTEVEVSGNMNPKKIKKLHRLPIDFISAGSITSAAGHADFSLLMKT